MRPVYITKEAYQYMCAFIYYRTCSLTTERVLLPQNVFSYTGVEGKGPDGADVGEPADAH